MTHRFDEVFSREFPDHFRGKKSLCPFHEDANPSFLVEQDHGFCFAGCAPQGGKSAKWSAYDIYMARHGASGTFAGRLSKHIRISDVAPQASSQYVAY